MGVYSVTTEDVKRQKADVLLAFQEAEEHLVLLRNKARAASDTLETFASWLQRAPENRIFRADQAHHGHGVELTSAKYAAALEPNQYFELADDIRKAIMEVRRLGELKTRLGLR